MGAFPHMWPLSFETTYLTQQLMSQNGITHVFVVEFSSVEDRNYYAREDPEHLAFGASLGPIVKQVQVVDIEDGVF